MALEKSLNGSNTTLNTSVTLQKHEHQYCRKTLTAETMIQGETGNGTRSAVLQADSLATGPTLRRQGERQRSSVLALVGGGGGGDGGRPYEMLLFLGLNLSGFSFLLQRFCAAPFSSLFFFFLFCSQACGARVLCDGASIYRVFAAL